MQHFDNKENLGLIFARARESNGFSSIHIAQNVIDINTTGAQDYIAPLYVYPSEDGGDLFTDQQTEKQLNFTIEFNKFLHSLDFNTIIYIC